MEESHVHQEENKAIEGSQPEDGGDGSVQHASVVNQSFDGNVEGMNQNQSFITGEYPAANVSGHMGDATPPMIDTFLIAQQNKMLKEFGAMLPNKDVYCMPNGKSIDFLK